MQIINELVKEFNEWSSIDTSDLTEEEYYEFDTDKYDVYRTMGGPNKTPQFYLDK